MVWLKPPLPGLVLAVVFVDGINSLCLALLTPLPRLMLFLLNVVFFSLIYNEF